MSIQPNYHSIRPLSAAQPSETIRKIQEKLGMVPLHGGAIQGRDVDHAAPIKAKNSVTYTNQNQPKTPARERKSPEFKASGTPPRKMSLPPLPPGFRQSPAGEIPIPPRPSPHPKQEPIPVPPRPAPRSKQETISVPPRPTPQSMQSAPLARRPPSQTTLTPSTAPTNSAAVKRTRSQSLTTPATQQPITIEKKVGEVNNKLNEVRRLSIEAKQLEKKLKDVAADKGLKSNFPIDHSSLLTDMTTLLNQKRQELEKQSNSLRSLTSELKGMKSEEKREQKQISAMVKNVEKDLAKGFALKPLKDRSMKNTLFKTKLDELEGALKDTITKTKSSAGTEQDVQTEMKKMVKTTGKDESTILKEIAAAKQEGKAIPQEYKKLASMINYRDIQLKNLAEAKEKLEMKYNELNQRKSSNKKFNLLYNKIHNEANVILHSENKLQKMDEWWDRNKSNNEIISGFTKSNNETFGGDVPFRKPIEGIALWDNSLDLLARREEKHKESYMALKQNIHTLADAFNEASPVLGGFWYKQDIENETIGFRPEGDPVWNLSAEKKTKTVESMRQLYAKLDALDKDFQKFQFTPDSPLGGEMVRQFILGDISRGKDRLNKLADRLGVDRNQLLPKK